jgi:hypothetical protein
MKAIVIVLAAYAFNPLTQPQIVTFNPVRQWLIEHPVVKPRRKKF